MGVLKIFHAVGVALQSFWRTPHGCAETADEMLRVCIDPQPDHLIIGDFLENERKGS